MRLSSCSLYGLHAIRQTQVHLHRYLERTARGLKCARFGRLGPACKASSGILERAPSSRNPRLSRKFSETSKIPVFHADVTATPHKWHWGTLVKYPPFHFYTPVKTAALDTFKPRGRFLDSPLTFYKSAPIFLVECLEEFRGRLRNRTVRLVALRVLSGTDEPGFRRGAVLPADGSLHPRAGHREEQWVNPWICCRARSTC